MNEIHQGRVFAVQSIGPLPASKDRVQRKDIEEKEIVHNSTEFEGDLLKTGGIPFHGLDLLGGELR